MEFVFVEIYGLHTIHDRLGLWEDLRGLVGTSQGPWLCMGDYNAILQNEDKPQGSQVQDMEVKDFNEFFRDTGMCELKTIWGTYTWTSSHTCSRIDRALVNADWMIQKPIMEGAILGSGVSYHSPLKIVLNDMSPKRYKTFRFFNCTAEHKSFLPLVMQVWLGEDKKSMREVWRKLKKVTRAIKVLNNT